MEMEMKTYGFDFGLREGGKIYEFKSRKHAAGHGNGILVATTAEEILASSVTTQQMVSLYNRFFDKQPVKGYPNKQAAARSMIALAQAKAVKPIETDRSESMSEVKKELDLPVVTGIRMHRPTKVKASKVDSNGRRGRNSMFDGRRFKVKDGVTTNPRREGTKGHASFLLLLDSPDGLKYEDYLAAGGRRVDLAWDLIHGNVEVA
jgi:hypothetical protein